MNLVSMLTRKCAVLLFVWPLLRTGLVLASESCFYCRGINCQRTSYQATERCEDQLDACITVFQGGEVRAQGCQEQLEDDWRHQCKDLQNSSVQCEICVTEKCNNVSSTRLSCLQCLDTEDEHCHSAPDQVTPQTCGIARSGRSLCYASIKNQQVERGCALTLAEQRACQADANCQLCDPLDIPHCNGQLLAETEVTTEPPVSSTTSTSSSSSTSTTSTSSTSTSTTSTVSPPTEQTTTTPTNPTTDPPTPSPQPDSAQSLFAKNIPILLLALQLAVYFYSPNK